MIKICYKCNISKDLEEFPKDRTKKDGYSCCCKKCKKEYWDNNKEKFNRDKRIKYSKDPEKYKKYAIENKERIKKYQKEYLINNKEKLKLKAKNRYEQNIENNRERIKLYAKNNKDKRSIRHRNRRNEDTTYNISMRIRSLIRNCMIRNGYSKKSKTTEILGCSFEEFKIHLESKFEPWMNWTNRGLYNGEFDFGWDLDHIVPSSSACNEEDIIKLNHYTNFQPLCSKMNRDIKRNKILP